MTRSTPKTQFENKLENEKDTRRSRFVVLRHDAGSQSARTTEAHTDWMFEVGDVLRTWATQPLNRFDQPIDCVCDLLSDHRLAYLSYEGEIEGDRGSVMRLLRGTYRLLDSGDGQFVAKLTWDADDTAGEATVSFYRNLPAAGLRRDDSRDCWRLRFSPG